MIDDVLDSYLTIWTEGKDCVKLVELTVTHQNAATAYSLGANSNWLRLMYNLGHRSQKNTTTVYDLGVYSNCKSFLSKQKVRIESDCVKVSTLQ